MNMFRVSMEDRICKAFSAFDAWKESSVSPVPDALGPHPYLPRPLAGTLTRQGEEITADTSSTLRFSSLSHPALSAAGITSTLNIFQGALGLENGMVAREAASDVNDPMGQKLAEVDIFSRVFQILGGIGFCGLRGEDILNRGFHLLKGGATSMSILASAVDCCFAAFFVVLGTLSCLSIYESRTLSNRMKKAEKSGLGRDFIGELTGEKAAKEASPIQIKHVYSQVGGALRSMLNEIDPELTDGISDQKLGRELFGKYREHLPSVLKTMGVEDIGKDEIQPSDLQMSETFKRLMQRRKQEAVQSRIFGDEGTKWIQKAKESRIYERLGSQDLEIKSQAEKMAKDLFGHLESCSKKEQRGMWAYLVCSALGLGVFTMGLCVTYPFEMLVSAVVSVACFGAMWYGDFHYFLAGLRSEGPVGKYAKPYVCFHLAVGLAAISAGVALAVMSGGTVPLVIVVAVGLTWFVVDGGLLYAFNQKEKQYQEKHPSLAAFIQQLQAQKEAQAKTAWEGYREEEKTMRMFLKLSQVQRKAFLERILREWPGETERQKLLEKAEKEPKKLVSKVIERKLELSSKELQMVEQALKEANENWLGVESDPIAIDNLSVHSQRAAFEKTLHRLAVEQVEKTWIRLLGPGRMLSIAQEIRSKFSF